jgi:sterol desaturase/sphingolipid hydroxylase (fatty acid hydroxylase superfamily)
MREFLLRCALSCVIALVLYFVGAWVVTRKWDRKVKRDTTDYDIRLGIISLLSGTPMLQLFTWAAERFHFSKLYFNISEHGWGYWLLSLPLYVLCWDFVFYLTHLVLHWPLVYRKSHFRHHACRPPVPWSGIAIDPFETILSGIMPYTIPLLVFPFHIYTVYALNILLMFWALIVHSSLKWEGNAILLGTKDHNLHHAFGLKNCNFAAVFSFWDRLGGTIDRKTTPPWWGMQEPWTPKASPLPRSERPEQE